MTTTEPGAIEIPEHLNSEVAQLFLVYCAIETGMEVAFKQLSRDGTAPDREVIAHFVDSVMNALDVIGLISTEAAVDSLDLPMDELEKIKALVVEEGWDEEQAGQFFAVLLQLASGMPDIADSGHSADELAVFAEFMERHQIDPSKWGQEQGT